MFVPGAQIREVYQGAQTREVYQGAHKSEKCKWAIERMAQDQARMTRTKRCVDSEFRVGLLDRVVQCYPVHSFRYYVRFLNDLPSQFHRRNLGSPAPTHYSIVMANSTPSPRHHQQVMSPNPLETTHDTVNNNNICTISIPAETLRAFASIGEDLSFAADIQAAMKLNPHKNGNHTQKRKRFLRIQRIQPEESHTKSLQEVQK